MVNSITLERVADIVGLSYDVLVSRLNEGESMAQVAESQGVAISEVVDTILAPQIESIQSRVKSGYLDESQAEVIIEEMHTHIEEAISTPSYGSYTCPAPHYGICIKTKGDTIGIVIQRSQRLEQ